MMADFDPNSAFNKSLRDALKRNQELVSAAGLNSEVQKALRLYSEQSARQLSDAVRGSQGALSQSAIRDLQRALKATSVEIPSTSVGRMWKELADQHRAVLQSPAFNGVIQEALRQAGQSSPAERVEDRAKEAEEPDPGSVAAWANWVARLTPGARRLVLGALLGLLAALTHQAATIADSDQLQVLGDALETIMTLIVVVSAINEAK